jgi:integrase
MSSCEPHLKPIVTPALNTGMRRRKILGLKWDNVNLKHGFIFIVDGSGSYFCWAGVGPGSVNINSIDFEGCCVGRKRAMIIGRSGTDPELAK